MKSLFDTETYNEIKQRLNDFTEHSPRQWGTMNNAQMLAHCKEAFKVPLSETDRPRMFMGRLFGWMMKSKLYNDSLWSKGLPTASDFIIKDPRNFENEKQKLIALVDKIYFLGPDKVGNRPHPFFGTFTKSQWGQNLYKHLDHHLRQFNT